MARRPFLARVADEARYAIDNLSEYATDLAVPTVRLGVTGLARSGKTVFISALIHNLMHGGRLPLFDVASSGRLAKAMLEPQPDDDVPRFDVEAHVAALVDERVWPESTRQVSELRLTIEYESAEFFSRTFGRGRLHLDIVDYPGEWLLDLPLLDKDYREFSQEALATANKANRRNLAVDYLALLAGADPAAEARENTARELSAVYRRYLAACRADEHSLSMLPPGRFLMPGDLEGSPALTFAPLDIGEDAGPFRHGSLAAMMERRFEAYKTHVVRPFFRDHFARLDRQIVLVDALHALNAGPSALADLEAALGEILTAFRPGRASWLFSVLSRRIDRILFAATKADHLNREDHDRLENILARLVERGARHAKFHGADVEVMAIAAVRATREASVKANGDKLPAILGTPLPGEVVDGETYDGETEIALFPGDLPDNLDDLFAGDAVSAPDVRFVRFRPPKLERTAEGVSLSLPHIRLDRALQFLLGDRLA
ncbi:YcjX family protein [Stappia sp. GBMRC 2046]|uniref:YcjX family protein n=1 Tax=Stappia sediminis TaxID=2692190 RepID=A0A7X3LRD5_9HYPH|nr:YcjX family protein [Stappia sediminis]MXN63698.1 YcjX family protein [Stappia sediminis]